MSRPLAGKHYPRSLGEFQAWFWTDADCLDSLEWLRWPDTFTTVVASGLRGLVETTRTGLWLGCAGIHLGGGISGRPGLFAARAMLRL